MAADGLVRVLESNRQTSWVDIGVRKNESVAVGAGRDAERLDRVIDVTGRSAEIMRRRGPMASTRGS